jgi:hypothetical protein
MDFGILLINIHTLVCVMMGSRVHQSLSASRAVRDSKDLLGVYCKRKGSMY